MAFLPDFGPSPAGRHNPALRSARMIRLAVGLVNIS
jgi:hypothetical protein